MLMLTRNPGQRIVINDNIIITIIKSRYEGNQVRVGIEASSEISIHREEIYKKIQEEKKNSKIEEKKNSKIEEIRKRFWSKSKE